MKQMNKKIELNLPRFVVGVVADIVISLGCVIVLCSAMYKGDINIAANVKIGSIFNLNVNSNQQIDASDQSVIMVDGVQIPSAIEQTSVETRNLRVSNHTVNEGVR